MKKVKGNILHIRDISELDQICVTKLKDYSTPKIWLSYRRTPMGMFYSHKHITYCNQFKKDLREIFRKERN